MASRTAILSVRILMDQANAAAGFTEAGTKVQRFEAGLKKAAIPAAAVGVAMVAAGKQVVGSASRQQQAMGAVDSVFGKNADRVKAWADTAATAVGLSRAEYGEFASVVGAQLNNLGVPQDQVAGRTNDLIGLGADLAATFGGPTSDAVSALGAALRGEADPAERYGLNLKQSAINARLAEKGLDGLTGTQLEAAKAQTILELATEQAGGALGQFAREADTQAGSAQIAAAQNENMRASLGEGLLPVVAAAQKLLGGLATFIEDNTGVAQVLAGVVAGLSASILVANGAMRGFRAAQTAWSVASKGASAVAGTMGRLRDGYKNAAAAQSSFSGAAGTLGGKLRTLTSSIGNGVKVMGQWIAAQARAALAATRAAASYVAQKVAQLASTIATKTAAAAQWLLNAAMSANPITLIIIAVLALVAAFVVLWKKSESFRNFFIGIWNGIKSAVAAVWNAIKAAAAAVLGWLQSAISTAGKVVTAVWNAIRSSARAVWNAIRTAINAVIAFIGRIITGYKNIAIGVWNAIRSSAQAVWHAIRSVINTVIGGIKSAVNGVRDTVIGVWNRIRSSAETVWNGIRSTAKSALDALMTPINAVRGAFDRVVDAVRSVIDWIKKIKPPSIKIPGIGQLFSLPGGETGGLGVGVSPFARAAAANVNASPARTNVLAHAIADLARVTSSASSLEPPVVYQITVNAFDGPDVERRLRHLMLEGERRRGGVVVRGRS